MTNVLVVVVGVVVVIVMVSGVIGYPPSVMGRDDTCETLETEEESEEEEEEDEEEVGGNPSRCRVSINEPYIVPTIRGDTDASNNGRVMESGRRGEDKDEEGESLLFNGVVEDKVLVRGEG